MDDILQFLRDMTLPQWTVTMVIVTVILEVIERKTAVRYKETSAVGNIKLFLQLRQSCWLFVGSFPIHALTSSERNKMNILSYMNGKTVERFRFDEMNNAYNFGQKLRDNINKEGLASKLIVEISAFTVTLTVVQDVPKDTVKLTL